MRKCGVCLFLPRSETGALFVRGVHSLNRRCVAVYWPISKRLSPFSEGIALSDELRSFHFRRYDAPQFSKKCGQKLRKVQKSGERFVLRERFEENSTAVA